MDLKKQGVAIVPLFTRERTAFFRQRLMTIRFPEFVEEPSSYVMGGFGAYGNPASFHNPVVREIRSEAHPLMMKFFQDTFQDEQEVVYCEQLFDRMCIRRKGTSTSRETWHRDLCPMVLSDGRVKPHEHVFGGWINFDNDPQYFSCALSTHKDDFLLKKKGNGFVLQATPPPQITTKVQVPPGHAIVFYQHILHQVLPQKQKKDSVRLFQAFRLSTSPEPIFPKETILRWIHDQATPLLPSGQHPPMYSTNHSSVFLFSNKIHDPIVFSQHVHPRCQVQKTCGRGKHEGRRYSIVHRFMTSLRLYQFPLYPPYEQEEVDMFFPQELKK